MRNYGTLVWGIVAALAVVAACGSDDDESGGSKGNPSSRSGCNAFCVAQSKLECGMPLATCYDLCRATQVSAQCADEDDAAETCQSTHISCTDPNTLKIDDCTAEMSAYSQCASGGGTGGGGGAGGGSGTGGTGGGDAATD